MSSDHVATRMSLISGLLIDVAYNVARNVNNVALYEVGRVFLPKGGERPEEQEHLAGAITGQLLANSWHKQDQPVDFFQIKGIVERYLHNLGLAETSPTGQRRPGRRCTRDGRPIFMSMTN